jgi:iron complex outermembrane recepter protein
MGSRIMKLASVTTACLFALSATPGAALAQASDSPATTSTLSLEEIVVTARKREERLLDVPVAVTAFTAEALERRGAVSLSDFLQEAPGVNLYDRGAGSYKVSIRGISTSLGANENGYYLDELPFTGVTVPLNPDVRAWDVNRVEVLRGPQGTLFGEGSMGGTVRILTRDAEFNEWQAQGLASGSDTSDGGTNHGYKAMINVPLIDDRLALRLAGTKEEFDGWIDDSVTGAKDINSQEVTTYRAKLRSRPVDRLNIGASYWHFEGEYPADNTADDQGFAGTGLALANGLEYDLFGATVDYDFGPARIFYSYANNSFELPQSGSFLGGALDTRIAIDVESHELRLSSNGEGPWQWTVGAYRRDGERRDDFVFALFGIDNGSVTDTISEAVFGEATYSLSNVPIDLTLGLRSVREKLDGLETNAGIAGTPVGDTYKSTNPRAIIAWRPTDDWRIYVSAAKGYRSGQLQPSVSLALAGPLGIALPATLQDDSIWSYEIGTKASLADGRATIEAAVYHSDWEDVTVRIPIGTTGFNGLINSEGTETQGVEASLAWRLSSAWGVNIGASYAEATYAGDVPGTGIRDGKPVDDHAKTTASASVDYARDVFGDLRGSGRLGVQYNSARDFPSFGPPLYLPGDSITTLAARFGIESDRWGAFLFADNLTNEDGAVSARSVTVPGVTPATASRLRPRTIGLELRFNFDQGR